MSRLEDRLMERRRLRRRRAAVSIVALLIFSAVAFASYWWFSGNLSENKRAGGFFSFQNRINILVMGVDERGDDVGRSDTMFVITVDTQSKAVSMLSVPRDTRVRFPNKGYDKINHAYALGGQKLAQQVVEDLLGINMDYYVMVNFNGFNKIIDAIGGIDIDVEKRMYYEDPYDDNGGLVINLKPGLQHMDGKTAIQYVRYRDEEGDIGRVARQQKFIKAVFERVASPTVITRIPAIIQEVSSTIKTNMPTTEMLNLAKILNDAYKKGLKTDMVPGKPAYISDVSYWLPDLVALREHIAQTLGVAMSDQHITVTKREATEYETSIPKEMKVIETPKPPKSPTTADKTKAADKDKDKDKTAAEPASPDAKTAKSDKIRLDIVNGSGNAAAGEKLAAVLRNRGFEVTSVSTSSTPYKNTVVISNTTNSAVVNKLTSLPFTYALQVTRDDGKSTQATVLIGKDYAP